MQTLVLSFDQYELDLNCYELRKGGSVVKLEKLPTELLILLAEKRGQLVTREQIIERLWGDDVFVDTRQGINTAIRKIRMALDDDPTHPRILQTIAGRGYRLLTPVLAEEHIVPQGATPDLPPPPPPSSLLRFPVDASVPPAANTISLRLSWVLAISLAIAFLGVAAIWFWLHTVAHPAVEQRVTSNPPEVPVRAAVVSPDGKYVAYADPTGLYLRQISSGETRPWPLPPAFEAWPSSWFPDSVHLLATRFEGPERTRSLWTISLLGGNPRRIMNDAAGGAVSPDGSRIAYLPGPEFGSELWMMDSNGANSRQIAVPDKADQLFARGSWIFSVVWSPNGKRLAYIECHGTTAPDPAEDAFSLRTRDAGGGDLQIVQSDPELQPALSWQSDGRIFYAHRNDPLSERTDDGVYSVRVSEQSGRATNQPRFVTSGQGRIGGLSSTHDGRRLTLWRVNSQPQVFITGFDASLRRFKSGRRLTLDANASVAEAWTWDSKGVLFVSNRDGTWRLFRQGLEETTAEVLVDGRSLYLPRLNPDGKEVLYLSASLPDNGSHPVSLMRQSLAGGPPQLVLRENGVGNFQCARSPSDLCILSKLAGGSYIFVSFNSELGEGREVTRLTGGFSGWNWTLSPDGRTLALFLNHHQIRFLSLDSGVANDVTIDGWSLFNGDWATDGKSIFMPSVTSDNRPVILDVTETGNARVVLEGDASTRFDWLLQSGDGRYGLLEERVPGENNIWMVEHF